MNDSIRRWLPSSAGIFAILISFGAAADSATPYPGTLVTKTKYSYQEMVKKLPEAVAKNKMGVVAKASATLGAKKIGVTIPGNMVVMVFHPKFAVRMLEASVPAGIEAPLRFYITENDDGTTTLTYRKPSSVFAPYDNAELDKMARELDEILARIAADATS
ncbi:MAG: hypothetical protein BMS9Abin14_559 [Gammaproteobacteria bacterium]|nr:MAG: hypothetical protein BMS9Abin14_559 [Gammaproteobacteria bacterium]